MSKATLMQIRKATVSLLVVNLVWILLWVKPFLTSLWMKQTTGHMELWLSFGMPTDYWLLCGSLVAWLVISVVLLLEELIWWHQSSRMQFDLAASLWGSANLLVSIGLIVWLIAGDGTTIHLNS